MGSSQSRFSELTEDILDEYIMLTYLSKSEILHLYKTFGQLEAQGQLRDLNFRFPPQAIETIFPQIKYNPFRDRIYSVFSSQKDGRMSFEDVLDLCSAMSEKCPDRVKAEWAFQIYDFDEDGYVGEQDISCVIDRLTGDCGYLTEAEHDQIIKTLMNEMDLESSGKISVQSFSHAVGKMSEFPHSFNFRF
ncbi:calcium and integrin-binding protein 1-like [Sitophilus oryzae]|uniref:Calcium and integrin-binding protein 1-like n=1 Tax=Sitophilus oryzae TaxID=7048 RepID=A0A6J2Y9D2_SITOR|nr:calcium and integrin-binding protein 1-like [Sitophilus oryzae]